MKGDIAYRTVVRCFAVVFRLLGLRITVHGEHHLPHTGGAVVAINHTSYLDFALVGYAARERGRLVRFMSKASVFELPVVGRLMRAMRHVPVDRHSGASAFRQARRALGAGELMGVFPEATISRSFRIKRLKPGAAALAQAADVPLVPCVLWGGHRVATVDRRPSLRRGVAVTVLLGDPIVPTPEDSAVTLTARLRTAMERLLDEAVDSYPDQPRDDADLWWVPADRGGTAPDVATGDALDREALRRVGAPTD